MAKKLKPTEMVELECAELGKREFELSHAQALIALEAEKGIQLWTPVEGSNYEIIDGSLNERTSTGSNQEI